MSTLQLVVRMSGVLVMAMLIGFVLGWFSRARAHNGYDSWQRPDGRGSCCSAKDCRPVAYRQQPTGIEIWITETGKWATVPPKAILPFSSPDADAHACYVLSWGYGEPNRMPNIWCVALPLTQ